MLEGLPPNHANDDFADGLSELDVRTSGRPMVARLMVARLVVALLALALALVACGGAESRASDGRDYYGGNTTRAAEQAPSVATAYAPAADEGGGGLWDDMLPDDPMVTGDRRARASDEEPAQAAGNDGDDTGTDDGVNAAEAGSNSSASPDREADVPKTRLIIYTGAFQVFVLDIEAAIEETRARAQGIGGWMKSATAESITIRVPVDEFEAFVAWLDELGRVTSRSVEGVDVTEEFYDLEIRLQNSLALRDRYQELLAKATTVEDTLKIEAELARITEEIELIKGRLRFLQQHASFSTVTVTFYREPDKLPQDKGVRLPFRWLRTYRLEQVYRGY